MTHPTLTTLKVQYYRGDQSVSVPGGVILRQKASGEFVVHNFSRSPGSTHPETFFWGKYTFDEKKAMIAFDRKVASMRNFIVDESFINTLEVTDGSQV